MKASKVYGLKCSNCGYCDKDIRFEEFPKWIGKECPECNEIILTEKMYGMMVYWKALYDLLSDYRMDDKYGKKFK